MFVMSKLTGPMRVDPQPANGNCQILSANASDLIVPCVSTNIAIPEDFSTCFRDSGGSAHSWEKSLVFSGRQTATSGDSRDGSIGEYGLLWC